MDLYLRLDTFPEIKDMLARLKDGGMKTAILSNGSPDMLNSAVEGAELGELLDAAISVDGLRVYKPHPTVYQLAVDGLDVPADRICFMSSNAWDVSGAAAFGFRVVCATAMGKSRNGFQGSPCTQSPPWRSFRLCSACE